MKLLLAVLSLDAQKIDKKYHNIFIPFFIKKDVRTKSQNLCETKFTCDWPTAGANRIKQWKRINCKQTARWQHLSLLKASAFLFEIFFVRC